MRVCPFCNAPIRQKGRVCPQCGLEYLTAPRRRFHPVLWAVGAFYLLLAIGAVVILKFPAPPDGATVGTAAPPSTIHTAAVDMPFCPSFLDVWDRIQAHAGEPFTTPAGLPFTYTATADAVQPTGVGRSIDRGTVETALTRVPLRNVNAIHGVRDSSFL
jgi:hypothetical protein